VEHTGAHPRGKVRGDAADEKLSGPVDDTVKGGTVTEDDAEQVSVLLREAEERLASGTGTLNGIGGRRLQAIDLRFEQAHSILNHLEEQGFFGGVIQIEGAHRDPSFTRDVNDFRPVETVAGQDPTGCAQQILPRLLAPALRPRGDGVQNRFFSHPCHASRFQLQMS
jgi:hypothetical protein